MYSRSVILQFICHKGWNIEILQATIKTDSTIKNGKLCATKRKFTNLDGSFETLEGKTSSTFIKQYNRENKHLFGEIINIVQDPFSPQQRRTKKYLQKHTSDIVNSKNTIPIQDVALETYENTSISNDETARSNNKNIKDILYFPLANMVPSESTMEKENYVNRWNHLRQKIVSLAEGSKQPSVTAILEKTMPPERAAILNRWKQNKIREMGEENFRQYQRGILDNGSLLHENINQFLSGKPVEKLQIAPNISGHWSSLRNFLPCVKEVKLLEERVEHPFLGYCGIVDCFASYKKNFVVIDWKSSEKSKTRINQTYDSPLQIAAYVGALNFDPRFNYEANKGLIAVAYQNSNPASIHYLDEATLHGYWELWLKRLKFYWENVDNYVK